MEAFVEALTAILAAMAQAIQAILDALVLVL